MGGGIRGPESSPDGLNYLTRQAKTLPMRANNWPRQPDITPRRAMEGSYFQHIGFPPEFVSAIATAPYASASLICGNYLKQIKERGKRDGQKEEKRKEIARGGCENTYTTLVWRQQQVSKPRISWQRSPTTRKLSKANFISCISDHISRARRKEGQMFSDVRRVILS